MPTTANVARDAKLPNS